MQQTRKIFLPNLDANAAERARRGAIDNAHASDAKMLDSALTSASAKMRVMVVRDAMDATWEFQSRRMTWKSTLLSYLPA